MFQLPSFTRSTLLKTAFNTTTYIGTQNLVLIDTVEWISYVNFHFPNSWRFSAIHIIFNNTPYKKVHWCEIRWSRRPLNRSTSSQPAWRKCLIKECTHRWCVMGWCSILHEVHFIEITTLFQCGNDSSKKIQVIFAIHSSIKENWAYQAIWWNSSPNSKAWLIDLFLDYNRSGADVRTAGAKTPDWGMTPAYILCRRGKGEGTGHPQSLSRPHQ